MALAQKQRRRIKVIQADRSVAEIEAEIRKIVDALLARRHVRVKSNGGTRRR